MARNRYQEIMAQYQQAQPFSFFGYPSTYSGGYVSTPAPAAPVTPYEQIMQQPAVAMGGGGRGTPEPPSAWSLMTPAERAAYYAEHPIEGKFALLGQDVLGWTSLGAPIKLFNPGGWYDSRLEKMGVNPTISLDTQNKLAGESMQKALSMLPSAPAPEALAKKAAEQAAQEYRDFIAQDIIARQAWNDQVKANTPNVTFATPSDPYASQYGPDFFGSLNTNEQKTLDRQLSDNTLSDHVSQQDKANARDSGSEGGNYGGGGDGAEGRGEPGGDRGGWGRGGGYALGGHVSSTQLQGPNPPGPDDGYGALKGGEYVINDKAVSKYGIDLMHAINSGRISKGKLRGLLEM